MPAAGLPGVDELLPPRSDRSGLYVVALTNIEPIAVNAHDARRAHSCITVNHENCKFGKARDLAMRQRAYWRTFGRAFVRFRPIALLEQIDAAERVVLQRLSAWRLRGSTGRHNEWLSGISAEEVERIALTVLAQSGVEVRGIDPAFRDGFGA